MKSSALCFLIVSVFILSGCNNPNSISDDTYASGNVMTFEICSEPVSAGRDTILSVNTINNPGFLTMAVEIRYDDTVMSLTEIVNGKDFPDYSFVAPKKLQNGCRICWFTTDLPNKTDDGEILELHFHVFDDTKPGNYVITISPVSNGGIVNGKKNTINIDDCISIIKILEE